MVWETDRGAEAMWTNMGQGLTDWPKYVERFQQICPTDTFVLEIISYKWPNPMPYLTEEFWDRYPKARAREFAQFVAWAKKGSPFQLPAGRPDSPESAQQEFDLKASLKYCRDVLGIGAKD
jgi:hypothetical protein